MGFDQSPPAINLSISTGPAVSNGRTTCEGIVGFLSDHDPAGRVVRAGPSRDAREVGRIPPPSGDDRERQGWPYQFEIIGSENGWLKIANAFFDEDIAGPAPAPVYSGEGWIAGGGVGVVVQSQTGFAAPSHEAPVLFSGYPDTFLDGMQQRRVVGCEGRWVLADWPSSISSDTGTWKLAYRPEAVVSKEPLTLRAWTAGVCNILETTCDGIDGNYARSSGFDR